MADAPPHTPDLSNLARTFLAFHIGGGLVGVPIIVLTFLFAKSVSRHPALVNFCATWILYSASYSMFLLSPNRKADAGNAVCAVQAAATHATPAMCVTAGLFLMIQTWSTFKRPHHDSLLSTAPRPYRLTLIILPPYAVLCIFFGLFSLLAYKLPESVQAPNGLYCTMHVSAVWRYLASVYCAVMMVILLIFEVMTSVAFVRRWRIIKQAFPLADRRPSLSLSLRVGIFSVFSWISFAASIIFLSDFRNAFPYMAQAALPPVVFLVFGSQKDIFLAWCFWKRKRKDDRHLTYENQIPNARSPAQRDSLGLSISIGMPSYKSEHPEEP